MILAETADLEAVGHVVVHAHVRIERVVLEHHRDAAILGLQIGHAPGIDIDIAAGGAFQPGHHPQQRGFAAAGRADHHDEFAVRHVEVDLFDHRRFTVVRLGDRL